MTSTSVNLDYLQNTRTIGCFRILDLSLGPQDEAVGSRTS